MLNTISIFINYFSQAVKKNINDKVKAVKDDIVRKLDSKSHLISLMILPLVN